MKFLIILACFAAIALAADDRTAQTIREDNEVTSDGFKYNVETDNAIKVQSEGSLKDEDKWVVTGKYSYISPEGENISIQYTADENGYRVDAASPALPTSPPIPEDIQKAWDKIFALQAKLPKNLAYYPELQ